MSNYRETEYGDARKRKCKQFVNHTVDPGF